MYKQGLNRSPDKGGFEAYCNGLVGGKSVKTLFGSIVRSAEYKNKFVNNRSVYFVVVNMYKTVLSRCPDKGGLLGWVAQLQKRGGNGAYLFLVDAFFNSREYKQNFGSNIVPNPKPKLTCPGRPF